MPRGFFNKEWNIKQKGSRLVINLFLLCIAHTLAELIFHRVFGVVELADTTAKATHELRDFLATEQQHDHEKDEHDLGAANFT